MANVGDRHRQVAARRQDQELRRSINLSLKHFQKCSRLGPSAAHHPIFEVNTMRAHREIDDMSLESNSSPFRRNTRPWQTEPKAHKPIKRVNKNKSKRKVHKNQSNHASLKQSRENAAGRVKKLEISNQNASDQQEQQQQSKPRRPSDYWMDEQGVSMGAAALAAQRVRERAKLEQDLWSSRYKHVIDNQTTSVESMHMDNLLNFRARAIGQPPMEEQIKIHNIIEDKQKILGLYEQQRK